MTRRALVVGASGFLGRSVVDRLREDGVETRGTYRSNRCDGATCRFDLFADDPTRLPFDGCDAVVFTAHVERTDHDRDAFVDRVERLLAACGDRLFVYVSSAGVFDGDAGRYLESDEPTPKSKYGRRLRAFERRIADRFDRHCVVRPDYLFGYSRGRLDKRLSHTRERVLAGETVAYFDDMYKSPAAVTEVAAAVAAAVTGDLRGLLHVPSPRTTAFAFHRAGMAALGLPYRRVVPESMPDDPTLHRDSSLRSERFVEEVGFQPRSVWQAIRPQVDPPATG
ncbi:sugar nucleotide-binding protein [Halomarina pelagica]|uniref:sugar nucleotide-binding protein n=1 Tax=Halomarina pelagica TaxID=2961599 RepID=UPI0020C314D1|nr:sugar nucleotide-binding protein [Halomarina sp. BND7]